MPGTSSGRTAPISIPLPAVIESNNNNNNNNESPVPSPIGSFMSPLSPTFSETYLSVSPCCLGKFDPSQFSPPLFFTHSQLEEKKTDGPWELTTRDLGEGTTGHVCLAKNLHGVESAAKIVKKCHSQPAHEIRNEIRVLSKIDHPHIIKKYHHEENNTHIFLFMEYLSRGDLYSYIEKNGVLPMQTTKKIMLQIVDALFYLHVHKQICHHDVKLENIVIDDNFDAKLIDFGYAIDCSAILHPDRRIRSFNGSPAYSAPEVLFRTPHSKSCDVFSLGVCLYFMLYAKFPFCDDSSTFTSLCKNVKQNAVIFPENECSNTRDLLTRMLVIENRISLVEIRQHPFFREEM